MPLFEYTCSICNTTKELIQYNPLPPICCEQPMIKQISKTSFTLKGDGWYRDNYETKSNKETH